MIKRKNPDVSVRNYQYRLYPTPEQEKALDFLFWGGRMLYNQALAYKRDKWEQEQESVSYFDMCEVWGKKWREPEDAPAQYKALNMNAGKQVLRRLFVAYERFFKDLKRYQAGKMSNPPGFPKFKGRHFFNALPFVYRNGARIRDDGRLYIMNAGNIRVRWHDDGERLEDGEIKQVLIKRKAKGWFVCFLTELPDGIERPSAPDEYVGIDVGLFHALALSDGTIFDAPKPLKENLVRLRVQQRRISRRVKGSTRRRKAVQQVAKTHETIANQRRDYWHKVTDYLVSNYSVIALEDLNLGFMLKNKHLSRAAHDVSLGIFYQMLEYKAQEAGVKIIRVNPAYTSQTCSHCGIIKPKSLAMRIHRCECGLEIDRDVNAAINILNLAIQSAETRRSGANVGCKQTHA